MVLEVFQITNDGLFDSDVLIALFDSESFGINKIDFGKIWNMKHEHPNIALLILLH